MDWVGCGRIKRFRSFDFFGSPNGPVEYVIEYDDDEEYNCKCQEIMGCIAEGKIMGMKELVVPSTQRMRAGGTTFLRIDDDAPDRFTAAEHEWLEVVYYTLRTISGRAPSDSEWIVPWSQRPFIGRSWISDF